MSDYCGGEYCCPYIISDSCRHCGKRIERYPNRPNDAALYEWHHLNGSLDCPDWQGMMQAADPQEVKAP